MSDSIPLSEIRPSEVALRAVNRDAEKYIQLVESIKEKGILNAIVVREATDPETGEKFYSLIDGLHRFTGASDAGLDVIPATVRNMDDAEVLEAQIIGNIHNFTTRPVEYSKQLLRILSANPVMTITDLAKKLSQQTSWVSARLGLVKLDEKIQELVDTNKIGLSNAYALCKMPIEEQTDWVDRAMTDTPQVFVPAATERVKEIKAAARQGREAKPREFAPTPHVQASSALKEEYKNSEIATVLCQKLKTPMDGFKMAVAWALHLDPVSVEQQKADWDKREAEREAAKKKRAKERADKKVKDAAEEQAKVTEG